MCYQKFFQLICLGTLFFASLNGCRPRPLPAETACPGIYMPVCASDGKTYSSSCEALKAGQVRYQEGECES